VQHYAMRNPLTPTPMRRTWWSAVASIPSSGGSARGSDTIVPAGMTCAPSLR
jgi:hypothetical protein